MKSCKRIGIAAGIYSAWIIFTASAVCQENPSSEQLLPNSTRAWLSVPNPKALNDAFAATEIGELAHDEKLKPFVDDLREQIRSLMNDDQRSHGLKLTEFEDMDTGEICVAGILPRDALGEVQRNKHGLILLVDVARCKEKATEMLKNTGDELRKNNATSTVEKISGIEATKWTFPKSENSQHERTAYQAMVGKWLISANNIELFEYVVKQITAPDEAGASQSLARDKVFSEVTARTKFDGEQFKDRAPQIRWFIDPFGYLDLARVIAEEDQDPDTKQRSNNFAKIVSNSGFDAIKGAAGSAILAAGDLELLHRAFIYAPAVEAAGENKYPKSAAILDLVNRNKISFDPEPWVPENAASYVTLTWNFEKVVNNVHHVVDAVTDQNSFENMLKNIKETNNVDVRKLVECLNNRISIATEIVEPINSNSEKIIIGVGIRQDEKFVQQQVKNFFGAAIKMEKAGDVEIYYEEAIPEEDENFFGLPEEEEAKDAAAAAPQGGDVLEQKFVAVHNGYILISGDKEYLKRIVSAKTQAIGTHADYLRVQTALNKLATADDVSARQFSRLDKVLEANYELLRNNELKSANTMLARSLASVREEAEKRGRKPKEYDPAKMPDYKSVVAPRLGKTGWVLESKPDGWLINSCLLKREAAEAVNKTDTAAEIKPHDNR